MRIATINCGSSSLKADVLDSTTGERFVRLRAQRLGTEEATVWWDEEAPVPLGARPLADVLAELLPALFERGGPVEAVGHRVVHGGERADGGGAAGC